MSKKKSLITIVSSALFVALATTGISIAWFSSVANMSAANNPIGGVVQDTYYESGDGTQESPYVITRPRHLYNLAWLQDLGFYNKHDGSEDDRQFYFVLGDNIDMSKFGAIPPIGTEKNPFVGNFDGRGFVISGVTISNDFEEYNSHPSVISEWNGATTQPIDQPHILGLFGIVGDFTNANKPTSYSSSVNEFKNTGITGATIKTSVPDSLMGVAAGYVSGNMSNVLVDVSTVDVSDEIVGDTSSYGGFTQNISDYTLVGYTENVADVKKAEESIYDVEVTSNLTFNAVDEGENEGWGGSINMKTIYYRLYALKTNKAIPIEDSFYWKENRYYYNGVEKESERTGDKTLTKGTNDSSYTPHLQRYVGSEESGHSFIGNYNFFERRSTIVNSLDYSTTKQSYLYLSGGHYENRSYNTYYEHTGVRISDGNGHFLTSTNISNNANVTQNTTEDNAIVWTIEDGNTPRIYTTYNNINYYLMYYNTTTMRFTTTANSATRWNKETNASGGIRYTYNNRMIAYNNNAWSLVAAPNMPTAPTAPVDPYDEPTIDEPPTPVSNPGSRPTTPPQVVDYGYQLKTGDTFLVVNGSTLTTSSSPFSPGWTISIGNTSSTIYSNGYYIQMRYSWGQYSLSLSTSTSNSNNSKTTFNIGQNGSTYSFSAIVHNNTRYVSVPSPSATATYFSYERYGSYNGGNPVPYDQAVAARQADVDSLSERQAQWDNDYADYQQYLIDKAAYDVAYSEWETAHDTWESDEYYRNVTYPNLVNQYNTDVNTFNNSFYINTTAVTSENPVIGPDYHQTSADSTRGSAESHIYYSNLDTTYFPLNVGKDINEPIETENVSVLNTAISKGDLDPKDSNTGYIVSGSDLNNSTYTFSRSNIRISEYAITNINSSFNVTPNTTSTLADFPDSKIYTFEIDGSETTMNELDTNSDSTLYPRFLDTKTSFYNNSLTTKNNNSTIANANVYGLHFMPSQISMQSIVNASNVSILGNNCDNYELPVNSIDFNLKQKGVINFFAGTYFSDNNSFFSLYQIIRNNDAVLKNNSTTNYSSYNTIKEIKEIVAVYSNDVGTKTTKYSNIYKYKTIVNGNPVYTYSEPYRFDGNQNKFKMDKNSNIDLTTPYVNNYEMSQSDFNAYAATYGYTQRLDSPNQLGKQDTNYTDNRIYYFEFPMNSGEYCLGSVDGGTGAYLLYLDIGANAAKTERTIFYEHFTVEEKTYSYPTGVSLKDLGDPTTYPRREAVIDVSVVVDASDSACMRIQKEAKGDFTIDRNANSVALTRSQTNKAPPIYASDNITRVYETSASSDVPLVHLTSHTRNIKRMEYYDYNVNLEYLTVTIFVDIADVEDFDDVNYEDEQYYRTYVSQTIYSGDTTSSSIVATYKYYKIDPESNDDPEIDQRSSMKIYSTSNGIKYDSDDILDVEAIDILGAKMSDDLIVSFTLFQDNGNSYEDVTAILAHIDLNNINGTFYLNDHYIISFIPTSGSTITIKITSLANGATIYYETTLIDHSGQEIVEGHQP